MPVTGDTPVFGFPALSDATYQGLPPMLADALLDKFGNSAVDAWLASEELDCSQIPPIDRLA